MSRSFGRPSPWLKTAAGVVAFAVAGCAATVCEPKAGHALAEAPVPLLAEALEYKGDTPPRQKNAPVAPAAKRMLDSDASLALNPDLNPDLVLAASESEPASIHAAGPALSAMVGGDDGKLHVNTIRNLPAIPLRSPEPAELLADPLAGIDGLGVETPPPSTMETPEAASTFMPAPVPTPTTPTTPTPEAGATSIVHADVPALEPAPGQQAEVEEAGESRESEPPKKRRRGRKSNTRSAPSKQEAAPIAAGVVVIEENASPAETAPEPVATRPIAAPPPAPVAPTAPATAAAQPAPAPVYQPAPASPGQRRAPGHRWLASEQRDFALRMLPLADDLGPQWKAVDAIAIARAENNQWAPDNGMALAEQSAPAIRQFMQFARASTRMSAAAAYAIPDANGAPGPERLSVSLFFDRFPPLPLADDIFIADMDATHLNIGQDGIGRAQRLLGRGRPPSRALPVRRAAPSAPEKAPATSTGFPTVDLDRLPGVPADRAGDPDTVLELLKAGESYPTQAIESPSPASAAVEQTAIEPTVVAPVVEAVAAAVDSTQATEITPENRSIEMSAPAPALPPEPSTPAATEPVNGPGEGQTLPAPEIMDAPASRPEASPASGVTTTESVAETKPEPLADPRTAPSVSSTAPSISSPVELESVIPAAEADDEFRDLGPAAATPPPPASPAPPASLPAPVLEAGQTEENQPSAAPSLPPLPPPPPLPVPASSAGQNGRATEIVVPGQAVDAQAPLAAPSLFDGLEDDEDELVLPPPPAPASTPSAAPAPAQGAKGGEGNISRRAPAASSAEAFALLNATPARFSAPRIGARTARDEKRADKPVAMEKLHPLSFAPFDPLLESINDELPENRRRAWLVAEGMIVRIDANTAVSVEQFERAVEGTRRRLAAALAFELKLRNETLAERDRREREPTSTGYIWNPNAAIYWNAMAAFGGVWVFQEY